MFQHLKHLWPCGRLRRILRCSLCECEWTRVLTVHVYHVHCTVMAELNRFSWPSLNVCSKYARCIVLREDTLPWMFSSKSGWCWMKQNWCMFCCLNESSWVWIFVEWTGEKGLKRLVFAWMNWIWGKIPLLTNQHWRLPTSSSSRFLSVLACLILSVLSTIDQYQALAHTTLFWVVSVSNVAIARD